MKILNRCVFKRINIINIKEYIKILPNEYQNIDVPILLIDYSYIGYILFLLYSVKYNLPKDRWKEFKLIGGTAYYTVPNHNPHFILVKVSKRREATIFTLFHELRHWYQQKYLKQFHIQNTNDYFVSVDWDNHHKQRLEVDANNFAKKYCKKFKIKFTQKLGKNNIRYI